MIPETLKAFSELTSDIGEYKRAPVKIHIDESVKPVAQPHRRIPFHVRKQVEEKLDQLMKECAEGPTSWISPIVVVPKPNNSTSQTNKARAVELSTLLKGRVDRC